MRHLMPVVAVLFALVVAGPAFGQCCGAPAAVPAYTGAGYGTYYAPSYVASYAPAYVTAYTPMYVASPVYTALSPVTYVTSYAPVYAAPACVAPVAAYSVGYYPTVLVPY